MYEHDDDRLAALDRRLLVLEQLMRAAALDPDGRPFTVPEASAFFFGLSELVADVRLELRAVTTRPGPVAVRTG